VIVVDTNVVSELMKPDPAESVRSWAMTQPGTALYTTAITVAEVLYGIERLTPGRRKELLQATAAGVFATFTDKVLVFDANAAERYAQIVDARDRLGQPINGFDAQIASICSTHDCTLATRNMKDFEHVGVVLVDPWQHG